MEHDKDMLQMLLDAGAILGNSLHATDPDILTLQKRIQHCIELNRGKKPHCYGDDDCSSMILSTCPWRMSCGDNAK